MPVKVVMADSAHAKKSLKLELTESVPMGNNPRTMDPLEKIPVQGVQIIFDGVGTGFLSLSRLHQPPIEALKIDRPFVSRLSVQLGSLSKVRAVIRPAQVEDPLPADRRW